MQPKHYLFVGTKDRKRLERLVSDRNTRQKHAYRAKIVLLSADRVGMIAIAERTGKSKPTVRRWQERYIEEGVDGLLRDKTRPPGTPPIPDEKRKEIVDLTLSVPPRPLTHWTSAEVAASTKVSQSTVQRVWKAHGLRPHKWATFKVSNDPNFIDRVDDVIGLYVDPPRHAVVLSVDEKAHIQALERTQPGLPMKPGRDQTMTHDYKRNGTVSLFAALNILDGKVTAHTAARNRHQEFIEFLELIERTTPPEKDIHVILDNYATHKHAKVREWLAAHPRWVFHFTPTSCSWLNAVEGFFAILTKRCLRRGSFTSVPDLVETIHRFIQLSNEKHAKPFKWHADPDKIIRAQARGHQTLGQLWNRDATSYRKTESSD